jgi:hypothetical protein
MPKGPDERGKLLVDSGENLPCEDSEVGNLLDYFTDGMHDDFVEVEVYARLEYYDGDDELMGWYTFAVDGGEEVPEVGTYLYGKLDFCSDQEVYDLVANVFPGRFALQLCGGKGLCRSAKAPEGSRCRTPSLCSESGTARRIEPRRHYRSGRSLELVVRAGSAAAGVPSFLPGPATIQVPATAQGWPRFSKQPEPAWSPRGVRRCRLSPLHRAGVTRPAALVGPARRGMTPPTTRTATATRWRGGRMRGWRC